VSQEVVDDEERAPVDAERERDYDIGRLMAFSDGVFAIAITLLVLNVPVPDIAQPDARSRLPAALLKAGPPVLTFALSFFLVGFYWIRHHQLFRQLVRVDVWLLWLNLIVLFLISLLPFSSGVVGRYFATVIAAEVYAVNLAAIALAFSALYLYATRARLSPGLVTGLLGQGILWPLVVVAMVMVLAPLNLVVAYVIGATLFAAVGVYTAVPRTIRSAPRMGTARGVLRFSRPAARVTVRADATMDQLFRARFTGPEPTVTVAGNAVDIKYDGVHPLSGRRQSAEVLLNTSIPWRFEMPGGMWRLTADLMGIEVAAVDLDGGVSQVELRLPRPSGTVPIRIGGGADRVTVRRPTGVPVCVDLRGGGTNVQFDERRIEAVVSGTVLQSPDYAAATDRYAIELSGPANRLSVV
jgi:uncharacterized membrane protein